MGPIKPRILSCSYDLYESQESAFVCGNLRAVQLAGIILLGPRFYLLLHDMMGKLDSSSSFPLEISKESPHEHTVFFKVFSEEPNQTTHVSFFVLLIDQFMEKVILKLLSTLVFYLAFLGHKWKDSRNEEREGKRKRGGEKRGRKKDEMSKWTL